MLVVSLDLAQIPPARPLDGLSATLRTILRSHRYSMDLMPSPGCRCDLCRQADVLMAKIRQQPAIEEAVDWLLALARDYRDSLQEVYKIACDPRGHTLRSDAEAWARKAHWCVDDLGTLLADQVRAMTLRNFTDTHGVCPVCAAGLHPEVTE